MLHWPDSMMSYMTGDAVLFSNDAFGQHYCDEHLFNDEVDQTELMEQCLRYYAQHPDPVQPAGHGQDQGGAELQSAGRDDRDLARHRLAGRPGSDHPPVSGVGCGVSGGSHHAVLRLDVEQHADDGRCDRPGHPRCRSRGRGQDLQRFPSRQERDPGERVPFQGGPGGLLDDEQRDDAQGRRHARGNHGPALCEQEGGGFSAAMAGRAAPSTASRSGCRTPVSISPPRSSPSGVRTRPLWPNAGSMAARWGRLWARTPAPAVKVEAKKVEAPCATVPTLPAAGAEAGGGGDDLHRLPVDLQPRAG